MTFEEAKGAIGSLLLVWADIERSLRQEIARANDGIIPNSVQGAGAALTEWERSVVRAHPSDRLRMKLVANLLAKLCEPRKIRNGICHGLRGVWSSRAGAAAKLNWEINGQQCSIEVEELLAMLGWMSRVPQAVSILSAPVDLSLSGRLRDTAENRQWWSEEFGLTAN